MDEMSLKTKWSRFHRRVSIFNHLPFIDFVIAAGSMAMGTAHKDSDFDVIVGVRGGRIFTARFLAILFSGALGWRAKSHDNINNKRRSADKICLNHFVTRLSYRLSPPRNLYWHKLYDSLQPILGSEDHIKDFFKQNDWVKYSNFHTKYEKLKPFKRSWLRSFLHFALNGSVGNFIESKLKKFQIERIEKGMSKNTGVKPRITYSDRELELHPDTKRIEEYSGLV